MNGQENQTWLTLNNARANECHESSLSDGRVQPSIVLNNGVRMPQFGLGVYSIPAGDVTYNSVKTDAEMQQIRSLDREARYFNMPYEDQKKWFMQWNPTD